MIFQRWAVLRGDKGVNGERKGDKNEQTDDANLEVITGATQKGFLFLRRCLFWWHPLFDGGERGKREGKASGGVREASEQSQRSIAV